MDDLKYKHFKMIENTLPIHKINELALKEGNAKKPVYQIHKWWARRLGCIVRSLIIASNLNYDATEEEFWEKYYSKNEIKMTVLDPFMGGGSSLVEAKKMNAKTIGVDVDPLACFIAEKELEEVDLQNLTKEFDKLYEKVGKKIQKYYMTEVNGKLCPIINVFWNYSVNCPKCGSKTDAHPHYKIYANKSGNEQHVFCKSCNEIRILKHGAKWFKCKKCGQKTVVNRGTYARGKLKCKKCGKEFISRHELNGKTSLRPFAIEYLDGKTRIFKKVSPYDLKLLSKITEELNSIEKDLMLPNSKISLENRVDGRPMTHGYSTYKELFTDRQLLSLGLIHKEIKEITDEKLKKWLLIAFSDCLSSNNLLCTYAVGYRKVTPLFGIHAYTVPMRVVENNVWGTTYGRGTFEKTFKKVLAAKKYCDKPYETDYSSGKFLKIFTNEKIESIVSNSEEEFYNGHADTLILNQSSENISKIKDGSVDLILTDPPYYDNLNYSELADFYYQWLKDDIGQNSGIINEMLYVNPKMEKTHEDYEIKLKEIFKECHRVLAMNGLMIFSYHHNKEEAWLAMGDAIKQAGFIVTNILPLRSEGSSAYHSFEGNIKWDSIVILRKKEYLKDLGIKQDFKCLKTFWEEKVSKDLRNMKECDKLSFFRSLNALTDESL
ncbi:DNA methyltransferase [Methanococcus maripaludis]|uniref:DUF1156 domain-containing protein n=1 Tax=Methanococcus maripaludis TaxID=39152 RepID=A0A8T3VUI2_METMI|nr:DNA methyltransferase [Methanococcus maripaludis]MBG0768308.1 DUF1156 domain-containing protein [Methanococcus maripaludis]